MAPSHRAGQQPTAPPSSAIPLAVSNLATTTEWLQEHWATFRSKSRYFQLKAALVAGYVLVVLATVVLAPPPPPTYRVSIERENFGLLDKTIITIKNLELGDLENIEVKVDGSCTEIDGKTKRPGSWTAKVSHLSERRSMVLTSSDFRDSAGRAPTLSLNVQTLTVVADGDEVIRYVPALEKK